VIKSITASEEEQARIDHLQSYSDKEVSMLGFIFEKTTPPLALSEYKGPATACDVQVQKRTTRTFLVLKEQYFPSLVFARGAFRWLVWKKG